MCPEISVLNCDILFLCCSHFHFIVPPIMFLQYIYCTRKYIKLCVNTTVIIQSKILFPIQVL
jgi:hypothetical protein